MVRGSTRNAPTVPTVKLPSFNASIHNRFDIEVVDAKSGKVKQTVRGFNTICNSLWTLLCSSSSYFNYIHYGTGSGAPSPSDASLFSFLGYGQPSGADEHVDFVNGIAYVRRSIQLAASTAVGATITEVGIASGTSSTTLCTHAMLEDMNGNPVSITKTDTDVINIYATIYVHFDPKGYGGGGIRLYRNYGGQRAGNVFRILAGYDGTLPTTRVWLMADKRMYGGLGYVYPATSDYTSGSIKYDVTNKKIIYTIARLEASAMNIGGIRRICIGGYYAVGTNRYTNSMMQFDVGGTWYPYSEVSGEAVGTGDGATVDFALDFPYAHDAKVYIDGVETTDFTLEYGPHTSNAQNHVDYLSADATPDNHIPEERSTSTTYTGSRIFYNPAYGIGLATVYCAQCMELYASNDCRSWEMVLAATGTVYNSTSTRAVPEEFVHYKYWKFVNTISSNADGYPSTFVATHTDKKLHFATPPAAGAVITADYKTDTIAKDANHVFDMTFEIHVGEYNEG